MNVRRITRRAFLRAAGGVALFSIVPARVVAGLKRGRRPPSETVTRGVIGTGGMGMSHVTEHKAGETPETLAVCDVDRDHLASGLKKAGPACTGYSDFRRVLERKDLDVIHVATPPHWHALISIAAMQAGKDVFCEKPMTRFHREGLAVIAAAKRYGRMFQLNSYGRGDFVRLRRLVASGLLGSPLTARVSPRFGCNWKLKQWSGRTDLVPKPVPDSLDYDFWLGPAPFKPYHPHRVHQSFRGYWDYDGGGLGDMGMHWLDPVQYVLGKDGTGPVTIEAQAPWPAHPDAAGLWGRVTLTYADGTRIILESEEWGPKDPDAARRAFIEGPGGRVLGREGTETDPPGLFARSAAFPVPPRDRSFEDAVRSRDGSRSVKPNAEEGHRTVSLIHLANIAIRTGRTLR
ncbi:MAG: Gfo/Idh/MocA family oxidoreductase, partial [bacterium]